MSKIYDCFIFFNELELLELRLNVLDPVVDFFVLCEADTTHSGQPKPFYFEQNKDRFQKFLHKIIHVKLEDMPQQFVGIPSWDYFDGYDDFESISRRDIYSFIRATNLFNRATEPYYGRDFYQKEYVRVGLMNANDEDIIICSDCDEIPNPEVLNSLKSFFDPKEFYSFRQNSYYYYLNMFQQPDWFGSRMGAYGKLKHYSFNELRKQQNNVIFNGGWHFSFQGGIDRVKNKIEAYSHQELNNDAVKNKLAENFDNNIDPFSRSQLTRVDIDNTYPRYLLDNLEKYKHMIKQ